MAKTKLTIAVLFIVAIPLFLVTESVGWAVNDLRLYRYGFDRYDISTATGISEEGLMESARQIRSYFNSSEEPLELRVPVRGVERELFNAREVAHMQDVKGLVRGVYLAAVVSGLFVLGVAGAGVALCRRPFSATLARLVLWGSGLTIGFVLVVGLLSLLGFDQLFLKFHQLSFSNNLWQLNPYQDYLIIMFPQGFWFDATMFVGLSAVGQALVLGGASASWLVWSHSRERRKEQQASVTQVESYNH